MIIFLAGFRGSGKSTVGRLLARLLGLDFLDTDELVEKRAGLSISEIFEKRGESHFRKLEREEVLKTCRRDGVVVALGGGALTEPEVAGKVRESGTVVLLEASAEVLYERISSDAGSKERRPDLTPEGGLGEIRKLLDARRDSYTRAAHVSLDTGALTPGEAAEKIADAVRRGKL